MTARLFLEDSSCASMTATVMAVTESGIVLDRSVFYARSGGQPGDIGTLAWDGHEVAVTEAIKGEGDAIVHLVTPGSVMPEIGCSVTGKIDWARRHRLMRMHTTLHLLCAALPGVFVTGGAIGEAKSRLDFDMAEPPPREALETRLQGLIAGDHPVSASWVDENVLDSNPALVRTLSVQPPRGTGRLRLVRIGSEDAPVDLQPCGGTHVARTGEIGAIRISKIENKEWLADNLGEVLVFDCTKYLPNEPRDAQAEFAAGHIPSAHFFDIDAIADTDSDMAHMVPSAGRFARMVGALGISNSSRVVFYDQKGLFSAARGWWMMGLFGHDRSGVLDGGLPKWIAEGRALEAGAAPKPKPVEFRPDLRATRLRGIGDMLANVTSHAEIMVDARAAGRFNGTAAEPRPGIRGGHIPGAVNLPVTDVLGADQTMLPKDAGGDELRQRHHRDRADPCHGPRRSSDGRRL
eukprot:gene13524-13643_t